MTTDSDFKALVRARMTETGETYTAARQALLARRADDQRHYDRTVSIFFDRGRLRMLPARRKARAIVLLELITHFDHGRDYAEREVNAILGRVHDDFAFWRRELINHGYLTREAGIYRVADEPPERTGNELQEFPADERRRFLAATRGRSALDSQHTVT